MIPELKAKLSLDLNNWNTNVDAAKKSSAELEKRLDNLKKVGMGFTAVGGAITASLGLVVKSFISTGGEIKATAQAMQLGTEQFQRMAYAASQSQTDVGALNVGMRTLARTIVGAAEGQKTYQDNLRAIGLDYKDLISLAPEKQFEMVGQAIAALESPTQRAAASLELFGRSGGSLLEAAKDMAELSKRADELGITISSSVIDAGNDLGDAFSTVSDQVRALVANLGASLAPTLMSLTTIVQNVLAGVIGFVKENPRLITSVTAFAGIVGTLTLAFGALLTAVTVLTPAIATLGITLSAAIWPITLIVGGIAAAVAVFVFWQDVVYGLKQAFDWTFKQILSGLTAHIQTMAKLLGWVPGIGAKIKDAAAKATEEMAGKIAQIDQQMEVRKEERARQRAEKIKAVEVEQSNFIIQTATQTEEELKKIEEERRKAVDARFAYEKSQFENYSVEKIGMILREEQAELEARLRGLDTQEAAYYEVLTRLNENRLMMQTQYNDRILNSETSLMGGLESLWSNSNKKWKDLETGKVSIAQTTMDTLVSLQSSGIKELAAVGKAAAIVEATMNTYTGATKALAQGGFWGIAMAAAVVAAGLANVAKISGLTFAQGGIVPGASFTGDRVLANVNSGEMILNEAQQARLFNLANGNGAGFGFGGTSGVNIQQQINIENGVDIEGIIDALRRGTLEALELANLTVVVGNKQAGLAV